MLPGSAVAAMLGVSRETLAKQRRSGRLLAIETGSGDFLFPACQFKGDRPLPGLDRTLSAFRAADPWYRLQVLLTPDPNLGGDTPLSALRAGRVAEAVSAIEAHDDL